MTTNLYGLIENRPGHPNYGQPFYIGIGTAKRPGRHLREARSTAGHRNWRLQEVLGAHFLLAIEPLVRILGVFDDKVSAGEAEKDAIARYGRMGIEPNGILTNLASGGQGPDAALMQLPEIRKRNSDAQKRRSPESRAASDAALVANRADPAIEARRQEHSREPATKSWLEPEIRARRTEAMAGKKKTMTEAAISARRAAALAPKSAETLAAMSAAAVQKWANPVFRAKRSANQAAAWEDPEKRANMLAGRAEGIAKSWDDPEVRQRRKAGVAQAVAAKWADDPEYAARARAGLRAAWQDPERRAARVAKMLESRRRKAAERAATSGDLLSVVHGDHDLPD